MKLWLDNVIHYSSFTVHPQSFHLSNIFMGFIKRSVRWNELTATGIISVNFLMMFLKFSSYGMLHCHTSSDLLSLFAYWWGKYVKLNQSTQPIKTSDNIQRYLSYFRSKQFRAKIKTFEPEYRSQTLEFIPIHCFVCDLNVSILKTKSTYSIRILII